MHTEISAFGYILLFFVGGTLVAGGAALLSALLRPSRPSQAKAEVYESGEQAIGGTWGRFNFRYYVVALIFVLFEVEMILLFPWAAVFGSPERMAQTDGMWGWFVLLEAFVFIFLLALGLLYAWKKGLLEWKSPQVRVSDYRAPIPPSAYDKYLKNK